MADSVFLSLVGRREESIQREGGVKGGVGRWERKGTWGGEEEEEG
jgi:hypothetical protein